MRRNEERGQRGWMERTGWLATLILFAGAGCAQATAAPAPPPPPAGQAVTPKVEKPAEAKKGTSKHAVSAKPAHAKPKK